MNNLLNNRQFHIEFNGHLTDHSKHAVVALNGLGASKHIVENFYKKYSQMTTYGFGLEPALKSDKFISENNWEMYLGERMYFNSYFEFFYKEIESTSVSTVIQKYFPKLADGWAGAVSHATIHIGFGIEANNATMISEGLAYLCYTYVKIIEGNQRCKVIKLANCAEGLISLAKFWEIYDYNQWFEEISNETPKSVEFNIHPELYRSGLQYKMHRILSSGFSLFTELSTFLNKDDIDQTWDDLFYGMTLLYLYQPGDFVLLHLLTSLYSILKISKHLQLDEVIKVQKLYWLGAQAFIHTRGEIFSSDIIKGLHRKYFKYFDSGTEKDWNQTVNRTFYEEEEHNSKVVFVLKKQWERTNLYIFRVAANCLTTTPQLPSSFEMKISR